MIGSAEALPSHHGNPNFWLRHSRRRSGQRMETGGVPGRYLECPGAEPTASQKSLNSGCHAHGIQDLRGPLLSRVGCYSPHGLAGPLRRAPGVLHFFQSNASLTKARVSSRNSPGTSPGTRLFDQCSLFGTLINRRSPPTGRQNSPLKGLANADTDRPT